MNNRDALSNSSGGQMSENKVLVVLVLSEGCERICLMPLSWFWGVCGYLLHSLACRSLPSSHGGLPQCVCLRPNPLFFIRIPVASDLGSTLLLYDLALTNYIYNDFISK